MYGVFLISFNDLPKITTHLELARRLKLFSFPGLPFNLLFHLLHTTSELDLCVGARSPHGYRSWYISASEGCIVLFDWTLPDRRFPSCVTRSFGHDISAIVNVFFHLFLFLGRILSLRLLPRLSLPTFFHHISRLFSSFVSA